MARSDLIRRLLTLCLATALLAPAVAGAQDSDAPEGADPSWLPNEEWVNNLWLPFDEERLERLLRATRGEIFRHIRIDADSTLAQLGRKVGLSPGELARRLVGPQRSKLSGPSYRRLRSNARRVVSQGHMAQHFLFHALHQTAIPNRARSIFGVHDRQQFLELRRAEISPLQIGELHGRMRVQMRRAAAQALRDAAQRGVDKGLMTPRQKAIMLDRQLRQLPRWLGQSRYNGPTAGPNRPDLPPGDVAKHPTISADGTRVAWDAYRTTISAAEREGEIHVQTTLLGSGRRDGVSAPVARGSRRPYSAYNAVLAPGGSAVAYETAQSTYPLAKRVGQMSVLVRDLASGRIERVSHAALAADAPPRSAFNPSLSADGRYVAFEATDTPTGRGSESRNGLWLFDRRATTQRLVAEHGPAGAAFLPRLSGDGSAIAYTDVASERDGRTLVYVRALADDATTLVSRASGADGPPAAGDAYEPAISHDGSVVAFVSRAPNLGGAGTASRVYVRDLRAQTTRLVSGAVSDDAIQPAISPDGRFVAFVARRRARRVTADNLRATVWLHDRAHATTTLVSRAGGATGARAGGYSSEPAVSADGTRVVFTSTAGNLSRSKPPGLAGVFVRDLRAATTTLLSSLGSARLTRAGTASTATAAAKPAGAGGLGARGLVCPLSPWHELEPGRRARR